MKGSAELAALTTALEETRPACAGDDRFIADALTRNEGIVLRSICARCPLFGACGAYGAAGAPEVGFWAGINRGGRAEAAA